MQSKVVVVTGASCGIGAAVAALLAERGYTVFGLSRRGTAPSGVRPLSVDVTDPRAVGEAVAAVCREAGGIDLAVLAAGFGIAGAIEHLPPEAVADQLAVNLAGVDNCLRALTPALRERRGRVLALGSLAGRFPIPFQAHYSATKAALEALLRAYAGEVRPFGISVGIALLGDTATDFTAARRTFPEGDAAYGGRILGSIRKMERDERSGRSAEAVARALVRRLLARRLPRRFTVGLGNAALLLLDRLLPARVVDRIIELLYCKGGRV